MTLAQLRIRGERSIYSIDGAWFRARWHFSFDRYRAPEHMGIGTLRVFNHDTLVPGAVWPMHPHRDIEGITYVVAGQFEHADNLGNDGVLEPGGVQLMRLGRGAEHSERNHSRTEPMEFIQMWILPRVRGLEPSVEQRQYTEPDRRDRLLQIVRPDDTVGEGVGVARDVWMFASRLSRGTNVSRPLGDGRGGYLYLISGAIRANDERMTMGDAAYLYGPGELRFQADQTSELLFVDTSL